MVKIGELALRTGCRVQTIRYYEREGLMPEPVRTETNYRLYNDTHAERLGFIRRCRALDMTLEEIRVLLSVYDSPGISCTEVNSLVDEHLEHVESRIEQLNELRESLVRLRAKCHGNSDSRSCGILSALAGSG
mgnify:CR=1 FL=1